MTPSQQFIPIKDIKNDLVFLKDGSVGVVLTTSAVNFGLLFETEQISIIESFAGLLNSLSFPIQIIILSKRLNISSYLNILNQAASKQANPLLKEMTLRFRSFIESIIKENDVLDKQFYICLNVSPLEIGVLAKNDTEKSKKATTILAPRSDHVIKQLGRLGLKGRQLTSVELIKLFYDVYNPQSGSQEMVSAVKSPSGLSPGQIPSALSPQTPYPSQPRLRPLALSYRQNRPALNFRPVNPLPIPKPAPLPPSYPPVVNRLTPPFIVEELSDD